MAKTSPASTSSATAPAGERPDADDWPAQATQAIVTQVERVRDKTTGPILKGAHYAVFGAFAVSLGTVALVILVIGAVRFLDIWVPGGVWIAHSILGATLLVPGIVLYQVKAKAVPTDE